VARPPAGSPGQPDSLAALAWAWVEASCGEQSLPVKLADPKLLADAAELLAKREARAA